MTPPLLGRRYRAGLGRIEWRLPAGGREAIASFQRYLARHPEPFEAAASAFGTPRDDGVVIAERDRYGFLVETRLCPTSGLLWTARRYVPGVLAAFYDGPFQAIYRGRDDVIALRFARQTLRSVPLHRALTSALNGASWHGRRVADVGCSAGGMLTVFAEQGASVVGYDVGGDAYLAHGRALGLDLRPGDAQRLAADGGADVVFLSHVLEHVPDPVATLRTLWGALPNGGLVGIQVPGVLRIHDQYAGDPLRFFQNAHLHHFTATTLSASLEAAGFQVVSCDEGITAVGRKVDRAVSPPRTDPTHANAVSNYLLATERRRWRKAAAKKLRWPSS